MAVYDDENKGGGNYWQNPLGDASTKQLDEAEKNAVSNGNSIDAATSEEKSAASESSPNFDYSPEEKNRSVRKFFTKHKKKILVGGGLLGFGVGGASLLMTIMLPLKIEHMVTNLRSRFSASSENVTEKMTDRLLKKYILNHMIPSYSAQKCRGTRDMNCKFTVTGNSPISNLYRTWADNKIETKLAEKYGIEFQYSPDNDTWRIKSPKTGIVDIGKFGSADFDAKFSSSMNRSEFRRELRLATKDMTKWDKVMHRRQIGKLLERKYGVRRCVFVCKLTDKVVDGIADKKRAAKISFVRKVLTPRNELMGLALECFLNPICSPEKHRARDTDSKSTLGPSSEFDDEAIKEVEKVVGENKLTKEVLGKISKDVTDMADKGITTYIVEKILIRMGLKKGATAVTKAVPVVGWVVLVSDIVGAASDAGPKIRKLTYTMTATTAVLGYMEYASYADEIHTGGVDMEMLGSMSDALNSSEKASKYGGGTAPAESSPLYPAIMGESNNTFGALTNIINPLASAEGTKQSNNYTCADGKPVDAGKYVCKEEVLGQGNAGADFISSFFKDPPMSWVAGLAKTISGAGNIVSEVLSSIVSGIWNAGKTVLNAVTFGKLDEAMDAIAKEVEKMPQYKEFVKKKNEIMENIFNYLFPNPFTDPDMSGGRKFNMLAAGADVMGNDYAQNALGGKKLSAQQVGTIIAEQEASELEDFKSRPFIERIASTDTPLSVVSRLALIMPSNYSGVSSGFIGNALNPFKLMGAQLFSIITPKTQAATIFQEDPFKITQYGYEDKDIPDDPEKYWDDNDCGNIETIKAWQERAIRNTDENTQMPVNTTTEPCLLIKSTTGAAGGIFDDSLTQ